MADEWEDLRRDVALANRIAHKVGLSTAFGHISARIPGTNTFIFPTRASPALAAPERLLVLDTDGNQLSGNGEPNTEFWIHARIYAARPDVNGVAHVHSLACVVAGQIGVEPRPVHNTAAGFADGIGLFDKVGLIRTRSLGDEVAQALGSRRGLLLRGHGSVTAGPSVRDAVLQACYLEEDMDLLVKMLAAVGGDVSRVRFFTQNEVSLLREQLDNEGPGARAWEYYTALVEGRLP